MTETTIDFLRHGVCKGGDIFRGSTDVPLTEEGWSQMQSAISFQQLSAKEDNKSKQKSWQKIISSPLQRCRLFAEKLSRDSNCPLIVDDNWREIHFGIWEGRQISEVWESDTDNLKKYFSDPGCFTPEGGESIKDASQRLTLAWQRLIKEHRGQHVIIVQHGGTIRLLLTILLNMPLTGINQLDIPYACFVRFKIYNDQKGDHPVLVTMNPHALSKNHV